MTRAIFFPVSAIRAAKIVACCLLAALGGCTSTPQATAESDAAAKQYVTHPGYAALYVFRDVFYNRRDLDDSVLYVNGRLIGTTLAGTYFRIDVEPGEHVLSGHGQDQGNLKVRVAAEESAFVHLNVAGGVSQFRQVAPEAGKREIARCCVLLENWAPGQRPLLR